MTEIRQRVVCYITRGRRELLVFEHDDPGLQAGIQVVAGGIDEGETPAEAAIREALEEAGLTLKNPVFLGSIDKQWPEAKNPNQHWHFYWLEAPTETPDAWDHTVTAGEDDMGMVYRQRFVKLEEVKLDWGLDHFFVILEHLYRWEPILEQVHANQLIRRLELCVGSSQHPLFQKRVEPIYYTGTSDDVLFRVVETNGLAMVHLTTRLESDPRWPHTELFDNFEAWIRFERNDVAYLLPESS
jgi:8-oxo-dGTP diphosphatase